MNTNGISEMCVTLCFRMTSQKRLAEKELRALVAELAVEGAAKRLEARIQGTTAEQVLDRAIETVGGAK